MDVKIALKPGHAEIKPAAGVWLDPALLLGAIRSSGFQPRPADVRLKAAGTVEAVDGKLILMLNSMKKPAKLMLKAGDSDRAVALLTALRTQASLSNSPLVVESVTRRTNLSHSTP